MNKELFPQRLNINPRIYAYKDTNPQYDALLRIGQTQKTVEERIKQQYPSKRPGKKPYQIVLDESAMRPDGTIFTDHFGQHYYPQHLVFIIYHAAVWLDATRRRSSRRVFTRPKS